MNTTNSLWVWREMPIEISERMPSGKPWPKISIVTPSFNQGKYIEETIRSVIMQGYRNLEYIVIDGGSTDNTVEIIKKYEANITYWVSEKDKGQTHAINKGFEKATGSILAYLNSDDVYLPYTFSLIAEIVTKYPEVKWITGIRSHINDFGAISTVKRSPRVYNRFLYSKGFNLSGYFGFNQQVSTFWTKELSEGFIWNEKLDCCMDLDLWIRSSKKNDLYFVNTILGLMRVHADQKSKTICSDLIEIESRSLEYGLYNKSLRRLLYLLMRVKFTRFLLRKFWCNGKGKVIEWDINLNRWVVRTKYAF